MYFKPPFTTLKSIIFTFTLISFLSCQDQVYSIKKPVKPQDKSIILKLTPDSISNTIKERFDPPKNYQRILPKEGSFAAYLQHLPLKKEGALVKFYNGKHKPNNGIYAGVVDQEIGNKNLHQCADAIIKFKADYHYYRGESNLISFHFTNGFEADFTTWKSGKRVVVNGNECSWTSKQSFNGDDYQKYLETVFMYASTSSLYNELENKELMDMEIGDVLIQKGRPYGHAVIVVDMAANPENGNKVFMLAQSYMPAQESHILLNPNNTSKSPWFSLKYGKVYTPEWVFTEEDLRSFRSQQ